MYMYHKTFDIHIFNKKWALDVLQLMRVDPLKASGAPTGLTRTPAGLHNKGNKNVYIFNIS